MFSSWVASVGIQPLAELSFLQVALTRNSPQPEIWSLTKSVQLSGDTTILADILCALLRAMGHFSFKHGLGSLQANMPKAQPHGLAPSRAYVSVIETSGEGVGAGAHWNGLAAGSRDLVLKLRPSASTEGSMVKLSDTLSVRVQLPKTLGSLCLLLETTCMMLGQCSSCMYLRPLGPLTTHSGLTT